MAESASCQGERPDHVANCRALLQLRNQWMNGDLNVETKIRSALEVALERLDLSIAYLSHIDEDTQTMLIVKDTIGIDAFWEGAVDNLSKTYCRYTIGGQPDLTILDAGADLQRDDPAYEKFGLEFYVGIPVRVDGHVYGTLCFGDIENPEDGFDPAKRAFLTILALLIGHEIEGIEQRRYISVYERVLRHNLRNSLTVIYGHLNTLQNRLENDEPIAVIRNEVQELLTLAEEAQTLQDLLHSDVRTEPINMADMAERSVRRIRLSYPRAKIGLETPEQAVTSGISQIRVALEELLENAIIHSEKVEPSVKVEVSTTDRHVRLQVIDDGPGIPEDERRVLSNDGDISTTQHGSGLGLWLVRLIVQQSNGRLSFSRAKHGGSKIEMTFARTDNRPTETW